MARRHQLLGLVAILAIASAGCYTKVFELSQQPKPTVRQVTAVPINVGVERSKIQITGFFTSPKTPTRDVAEILSQRMNEEKAFLLAVYPYTSIAGPVQVTFRLDEKVNLDARMAENFLKAALVGASFFLLGPVLPIEMDQTVEVTASALNPAGKIIKTYHAQTSYRMSYTNLLPSRDKMAEFDIAPFEHAAEELLSQIVADRQLYLPSSP